MKLRHRLAFAALAGLALGALGCRTAPLSLPQAKSSLTEYVESRRYAADLERATRRAVRHLRREAPRAHRPAIVLDIDETSLSNWPYEVESRFCYDSGEFDAWVRRAEAEPIDPVLEFYRTARALGVAVFFISGRHPDQREATERNLRAVGYESWQGLDLRPRHDGEPSAAVFKTAVRRRIVGEGYTIVATVGDQQSDLAGGFSGRTFKLPNPFYEVP